MMEKPYRMRSRFIIIGICTLSSSYFSDDHTRVTLVDGNQNTWIFRITNEMRQKHHVKSGWIYKFTGHYRENEIPVVDSILHIVDSNMEPEDLVTLHEVYNIHKES